jgi:hypothetical protein
LIFSPSDELGANRLATVLGRRYQFLPHLGFICFPFDFINLQVHKPASADLLKSQFTGRLGEIHPNFSSRFFATGARLSHPTGAHRARMRLCTVFSLRACTFYFIFDITCALYAPVYALCGAHLIKI